MSANVNIEALLRMLMSPSAAPQLGEREALLSGFEPHQPPRVVELKGEEVREPSLQVAAERARQAPSSSERPAFSQAQGAEEAPEAEGGESYLAFLEHVQSQDKDRARSANNRGKKTRARSSKKSGAPNRSSPRQDTPAQGEGGGTQVKKRRRRRRAKPGGAEPKG